MVLITERYKHAITIAIRKDKPDPLALPKHASARPEESRRL